MMDFLYFPEDKTEYIPAMLSLTFFFILAFICYRIFVIKARKEEQSMKQFEEEVMKRIEEERRNE
ncbi:hypothetical protein [Abyssicoccus albus]|uniref:hypothetical protein n=1 Tax=Abyssicoccus albus TaxID=1817405 RepID=UPI00097E2334|nr:hypothetical protein [Abyssicoccus albus]AQL56607.1 hypothetical protein BVH56_06600 [Abyssicoccus albus]